MMQGYWRGLLEERMFRWKSGLAIAGLALTPLMVIGFVHGGPAMFGEASEARGGVFNEGARRNSILAGITESYVSHGENVTPAMREARQLAPLAYLNVKLERMGLNWRVARTTGATAETYGVS